MRVEKRQEENIKIQDSRQRKSWPQETRLLITQPEALEMVGSSSRVIEPVDRMKLSILISMIFLVLPGPTYGQRQPASRFGALELKEDQASNSHRLYRLLLNGKEILQLEGYRVEILRVLRGDGRDYLIVTKHSGGIACPVVIVVVEVEKSGPLAISEEFGSCSDLIKAKLINGRVIIETPTYTPHPEYFSTRELRKRNSTTEVFTWYKGKLSMRTVPR